MSQAPEINTERLSLRFRHLKYAGAVLQYFKKDTVRRFLGGYPPKDLPGIIAHIRRTRSRTAWFIFLKGTEELIGECELYDFVEGRIALAGYILDEPYWGRGYMSEAMETVLDMAFGQLGLSRVRLEIEEANVRSRALADRLGFSLDTVLKEFDFGGRVADVCVYSLTSGAWRKKTGLPV